MRTEQAYKRKKKKNARSIPLDTIMQCLWVPFFVCAVKPDPPEDIRVSPNNTDLLVEWSPPSSWANLDVLPLKYHIRYQWEIRGILQSVKVRVTIIKTTPIKSFCTHFWKFQSFQSAANTLQKVPSAVKDFQDYFYFHLKPKICFYFPLFFCKIQYKDNNTYIMFSIDAFLTATSKYLWEFVRTNQHVGNTSQ